MMTACFIGLGSIGLRHLKNVHAVAEKRGIAIETDVVEPRELDYLDGEVRRLVRRRFSGIDTNALCLFLFDGTPLAGLFLRLRSSDQGPSCRI